MRELDAQELQAFVASSPQPVLLLDVREPWEFELAAIHLDGARTLQIAMNQIPARLAELDASQPTVCICHHGVRSAQVVAFLHQHGFDETHNLVGGTDMWSVQIDPSVRRY